MAASNALLVSLDGVTATGAGSTFDLGSPASSWAIQVVATGSPIACIVDVEGSLDGQNWYTLGTWSKVSLDFGDIAFISNKPVLYIRANLKTLTGGSSPVVTACMVAQ